MNAATLRKETVMETETNTAGNGAKSQTATRRQAPLAESMNTLADEAYSIANTLAIVEAALDSDQAGALVESKSIQAALVGLGERRIQACRPRCRKCGSLGAWQVRPPVPMRH